MNTNTLEASNTDSENLAKQKLLIAIAELEGLPRVEKLIRSRLTSDASLLKEIPTYLLELGGKRMRPVLTLLVAKTLGQDIACQELIDVAAGIELIHMATLLHDDIIDNAELRRHQQSPNSKYGLPATLLAGDFLLVRAFSLCSKLDETIIDATERACVHLTEGEIMELPLYEVKHDRASALTIADKKTAALFELAAFSAGHIVTGNEKISLALARFGQSLGIAFQVLDDILDVTSDSDLLGKPSGTDIRERKPSIVNILWLESGAASARRLLKKPDDDESEFVKDSVEELRKSPIIEQAKSIALSYTDVARVALHEAFDEFGTPNDTSLKQLESLIDYTIERVL